MPQVVTKVVDAAGVALEVGDADGAAVALGWTVGATVAVGAAVGVGGTVPVGAAVGVAVGAGVGVAAAVGEGVAVALSVGDGAIAATVNDAVARTVAMRAVLPPFCVTTLTALRLCVPVAPFGTMKVVENRPLPFTLALGIPVAELSQSSWILARTGNCDPVTLTFVPAGADSGDNVRTGLAACVEANGTRGSSRPAIATMVTTAEPSRSAG